MSAIVGLFHLDGKPVIRQMLEPALQAIKHYGGDGSGLWTRDGVGFGHLMRHITPESIDEALPYEQEHLAITADARIDNRDELFEALSVPQSLRATIPDSQLILRAYEHWGDASPKHLIGEFAFAIWDNRRRELFCASDHLGCRPFYYYHSGGSFGFATDVRALWALPNAPIGLDELEVALYLDKDGPISKHRTLYEGISKLVLGHQLCVSPLGLRKSAYWHPFDGREIRFKSEADYALRLRELMDEAVACRLRTDFPVAAHLSGGLDSSSVAVLAARELSSRGRQLAMGYSYSPPRARVEPNRAEDEREKIERISRQENIPVHFVDATVKDWYERFSRFPIMGEVENHGLERHVVRHAAGLGVRTILTGLGGDQGITARGQGYLPELLCAGRWLKLLREWFVSYKGLRSSVLATFRPLLPQPLYVRFYLRDWEKSERFIDAGLACRYAEELRAIRPFVPQIGVHRQQKWRLEFGDLQSVVEEQTVWATSYGITHTYPMLDRRVLEFAYRIPSDLFYQKRIGAYLYRTAMRDVLPEDIVWNTGKLDHVRYTTSEKRWGELWSMFGEQVCSGEWEKFKNPYVDLPRLTTRMLAVPEHFRFLTHGDQLNRIFHAVDLQYLYERLIREESRLRRQNL